MAAPTPIVLTRAAAADRVQGEFTLVLSSNCSLWKCCTFLQDYNTAPAGGVHVLLASNVLEGVALFAAWADPSCAVVMRSGATNGMGKLKLAMAKVQEILTFAETGKVFAKPCSGITELVERMCALRLKHKAAGATALTVLVGDLTTTKDEYLGASSWNCF